MIPQKNSIDNGSSGSKTTASSLLNRAPRARWSRWSFRLTRTMKALHILACFFSTGFAGTGSCIFSKSSRILVSGLGVALYHAVYQSKPQRVYMCFSNKFDMGIQNNHGNTSPRYVKDWWMKAQRDWCIKWGIVCIPMCPSSCWSLLAKGFKASKLCSPWFTLIRTQEVNGGAMIKRWCSLKRSRTTSELSHSSTTPASDAIKAKGVESSKPKPLDGYNTKIFGISIWSIPKPMDWYKPHFNFIPKNSKKTLLITLILRKEFD